MINNTSAKILTTEEIFKDRYVIPLYQRNFAWGEEEITRFMQDVYESMKNNEARYFIGSLVVLRRRNGEYEVIDGQQRLTVLTLIAHVLQTNIHLNLHYDSRPEVDSFLHHLFTGNESESWSSSQISHFADAINYIKSAKLDEDKDGIINIDNKSVKQSLAQFFSEKVCLVREEIPEDTDVASYFEIMNNRGEQLQEHEIIKSLLLESLQDSKPQFVEACSIIWDACSQMNIRIQKSFSVDNRRILFGEKSDSLNLNKDTSSPYYDPSEVSTNILIKLGTTAADNSRMSLHEIISDSSYSIYSNKTDEIAAEEEGRENPIIDFPSFLMHILRLYYNEYYKTKLGNDIPLHEKYLLSVYNEIKEHINPLDFFLQLLHCRVVFDKFIIKTIDSDNEESRQWTLKKPYEYYAEANKSCQLKFRNTFGDSDDTDNDRSIEFCRIIKALSMLQVSYRSRRYKNYLQTIMSWFADGKIDMQAKEYSKLLSTLIHNDFKEIKGDYISVREFNGKKQGVNTPHYLFNYIDYLYWNLWKSPCLNLSTELQDEIKLIESDFTFLNWNSVEHHYPQNRQREMENESVENFELNCLGNMYLISKSANSRLSDKNPIDKASLYSEKKNIAPNRRIIYSITKEKGWGKEQIKQHLKCIEEILLKSEEILCIESV